jgi:peptidoglycan/xylan/chitin deacetylase (PgdA/CDA1 family)
MERNSSLKNMIFRNDDVANGCNIEQFKEIRGIFEEFGLREYYSVVPMGINIYKPNAHLILRPELEEILGNNLVIDDKKADNFIRESLDRGHKIALHGWKHTLITAYTYQEQLEYITQAKEFLENNYGVRIEHFVPPFNAFDYNTEDVCRQLGMRILGGNKNMLEQQVRENIPFNKYEHCWYHAWRFYENGLSPNMLREYLKKYAKS